MSERLSEHEILTRAARAVARIDTEGPRGITNLSMLDIEAMALALVILGINNAQGDVSETPKHGETE